MLLLICAPSNKRNNTTHISILSILSPISAPNTTKYHQLYSNNKVSQEKSDFKVQEYFHPFISSNHLLKLGGSRQIKKNLRKRKNSCGSVEEVLGKDS